MRNVSITQVLSIWTELEEARHGTNGFGSHTAEIYAYRVMPYRPGYNINCENDEISDSSTTQREAARSIVALCKLFIETHERNTLTIDGLAPDEWLKQNDQFLHRCHIEVSKKS